MANCFLFLVGLMLVNILGYPKYKRSLAATANHILNPTEEVGFLDSVANSYSSRSVCIYEGHPRSSETDPVLITIITFNYLIIYQSEALLCTHNMCRYNMKHHWYICHQ